MRLSCPVPSCLTGGSGGNVFMFYARRLLKLLSVQHIPWRIVSLNFNGLKKLSAEFFVVVVVVVAATFDRDDTRHMCAVLLCVSMCIRGYCSYVSYVKHVVGSILIKYNVCGWLPIMTRAQSFFCRFWFSGICWLETTKKEHAQIRMTQNWITFGLWHLLAVRAVIRGGTICSAVSYVITLLFPIEWHINHKVFLQRMYFDDSHLICSPQFIYL